MLKVEILGFNGIVLQVNESGIVQSISTGQTPSESEHNDGYYTEVLLLGQYENQLIPILINDSGEII